MPVPSAMRRPCAIVGFCVALVFLAAMLDAALWHYSYERERLRSEVGAATAEIEELRAENRELRTELVLSDLRQELAELERLRNKMIADEPERIMDTMRVRIDEEERELDELVKGFPAADAE